MAKKKAGWTIQRPGGGISLNAGHPDVLRKGKKVLVFPTRNRAVDFLIKNKVVASERELMDSIIEIVRE